MIEPLELEFSRLANVGEPFTFVFERQMYRVRTVEGTYADIEVPWDSQLCADLAAVHAPDRDPAIVGRLGARLRGILEPAVWPIIEAAVCRASNAQRTIQLVVRSSAAEIYALPWELLSLRGTGETLGSISRLVLRYEWLPIKTCAARAGLRHGWGRIVLAWSAAGGEVPVEAHIQAITTACKISRRPHPEILAHVSLKALDEAFRDAEASGRPIECLHLLSHGAATGSAYGLVLDGMDGNSVVIEPAQIQRIFAPYASMIRLVVVAACDSANNGLLGAQVGSVAQMLHRLGIRAVVASRFPLSIHGSTLVTEAFYRAFLVERRGLDESFVLARRALECCPANEWATLQLLWGGDDIGLWRLWSLPIDVQADLRLILGCDEASQWLATILDRPTYLGDRHPDLSSALEERVAACLVRRATSIGGLQEVFEKIGLGVAQLARESPMSLVAALRTARDLVEHLAPSGANDAVEVARTGLGEDFEVATRSKAALEIVVAREGGHRSFFDLDNGELVGRGRIPEPTLGSEIYRYPLSVVHEFIKAQAGQILMESDSEVFGGIEPLAAILDDEFRGYQARTPEGTPGLGFCPRYVDVDAESGAMGPEARRELKRLLPSLLVVARRARWSHLDGVVRKLQKLYDAKDKE